uniref:Uncharacterized protein n=1 Tax=Rhipicephalus pulchellus TaxID=72859 RepID=L7LYD0_RHIPC
MRAFIPLLLYCAAFLTNAGLVEARRSGILYYVRGWNGGYPFSNGAGPKGGVWLSPSATTPLAPAYANNMENVRVSTLSGEPNAGLVKESGVAVGNSGAGRLDDVSGPSLGFLSSINEPGGSTRKTFPLGVESLPKDVVSAGTESPPLKSTGGNASSVSSITPTRSVKDSTESPTGVGTGNVVHEKLSATSLSSHLLKEHTSNTGADGAPVPLRIPTLISDKTPSREVKILPPATSKLQHAAAVNGDLAAPQVGPTSIGAPGHLGAFDSPGLTGTVGIPSGHYDFNREPKIEGAIPTNNISRAPLLSRRQDTTVHENKSSGSVVVNTVSPSSEKPETLSLAAGHTAAALPLDGGALSLSKSKPSGNLLLDNKKTLPHKKGHNDLVLKGKTKSGLSLGTSASTAGLRLPVSPLSGHVLGVVNASGAVATVVSEESSSKNASESSEKVHVGTSVSAPSAGTSTSGSVLSEIIRKKLENNKTHGSSRHENSASGLNAHISLPPSALGGSAKPHLGGPGTFHFAGRNGLGNAAVKVKDGVPNAAEKQQITNNRAYGLFRDTSLPSGFSISSTGVPTGSGSNVFHSSKQSGYNRLLTSGVASINMDDSRSNEFREHVGRFQDGTPRTPAQHSPQYVPHAIGLPGIAGGVSPSSTAMKVPHPFGHVQSSPSTGNAGAAARLTNVPGLINPSQPSQHGGAYGSFIHTSLPSGFSISSTGVPTGPGSHVYRASTYKEASPTSGITGAATTIGEPTRPNEVREHEGLSASSSRAEVLNGHQNAPHAHNIEPPRLGSGTSESSSTLKASHSLVHTEASPGSGHARAVSVLKNAPGIRSPSLPRQRTGAYGFFAHTSLPSGFSISSRGTPIGAGSHIFRASKHFHSPSTSTIVGTTGTHDRASHTAEVHQHAGGSSASMVRTQLQYGGHSALHVGMQPFAFTHGILQSLAPIKNSHIAINDQASPITGKDRAANMLVRVPDVINPTQYRKNNEAYGSFDHTSLPPGFSNTGAPIGAGANIFRPAEPLGASAKPGIIGATSIPGQPSISQKAGEHTRGFPAIHRIAQFQNSGQYHAHFLGRQIPGYGSGILASSVPITVSQPSVHAQASASGNAGALHPLINVPRFISPPQSARIMRADGSFMHATRPPGFQITSRGAPIRRVLNMYRPSEHLGGSSGSGITAATVAPAIPSRYSEARDLKAFPASSGRENFGISGQYLSPILGQETPSFAGGISRSSPPLKMSHAFGRMQPSPSAETSGSARLLQNVPGLSNQPQSSQNNGAYDSFIYNRPHPGFSISNSRTPVGVRSHIFHSTERLQGSAKPVIIKAGGTMGWPLHRNEVHQDLGGILTSNARQPEGAHQFQSQGLVKQTYDFTAGISDPSANLNRNPNSGNAGVVVPFTEVNGANKAPQPSESSAGGQPSSSPGSYSILPGSAGITNFGSMRLANGMSHRRFRTPGDMRSFVRTELPQATGMLPTQPALADGRFRTSSDRRQPQPVHFGSVATYGSSYPGVLDSRFTTGTPTIPTVAVPKITDPSKPVGVPTGSPFTITGVVNERPTNPNYVSAFNGGFNSERSKMQPEVSSPYKYLPSTITSSSKTSKSDSYEPGRRLDLTNFEIDRHPLKWLSNHKEVPVLGGFTDNGRKTTSGDSSGTQDSTTRSSPTADGISDAGSIVRQGDTIYKPHSSSASEIVRARRPFLNIPRFEQAAKPTGRFSAAGSAAFPLNGGGYSLPLPETLPSSIHTGFTGPAHESGFKTYNPVRNFRDTAGYKTNRAINDLRRQSASATTPEYETRYLSVSRRQPKLANEYRFIPYRRPSRNSIAFTSSPSDKASRLSYASNRLDDNTGSRSVETGGGWKAGSGEAPIASSGFTVGSTRNILSGTGAYGSDTVGRGRSVFIGGSEGSPNTDTTMNSILGERLRGSMSSYPGAYRSSGGPFVPYVREHNSGSRFSSTDGFVVGHGGGRGNTDNTRSPVATRYRVIPASPGPNTGYPSNNPLYPSDGSHGYISRSTSRRHLSGYSGTLENNGHKGYQQSFLPGSASDSSVSSQDNGAWNLRGAWQGISSYPVSASN